MIYHDDDDVETNLNTDRSILEFIQTQNQLKINCNYNWRKIGGEKNSFRVKYT